MMEYLRRLVTLLSGRDYRIKIGFFVLIGLALFFAALNSPEPAKSLLLDFAVTLSAVAFTQLVWDFLGGDPLTEQLADNSRSMQSQITQVQNELAANYNFIAASLSLYDDILQYNLGCVRFWPSRRFFQNDRREGLVETKVQVLQSSTIDMLGITLWIDWMQDHDFRKRLKNSILQGTCVRLLLYEPESEIQRQRARDEGDPNNEMTSEIRRTVQAISLMHSELPEGLKHNLDIRYTFESHHSGQIIRFDDKLVASFYLSGLDGLSAPTIKIAGPSSILFDVYTKQFDILWRRSKPALVD